ncbi:MAG: electron transport complex subunit RsxC [Candidatus Omnitrophica bacterium]|nr:electron transport complex subunit RsxC [Candidatus Omnitrophota bacterium]MDD3988193.1 electron transport complex subunit RsxC [Candidatus Omnitrophota bacterium]MDD5665280.1 electron transport complex subunit RsxC [Candidatus Omnitrophota bacterium]
MVRLEDNKFYTEAKPLEALPLPAKVYIPLSQHLGKPCLSLVKAGDSVSLGQKIGSVEAHVYSPVHASVSGRVKAIVDWPHPVLGRAKAVVIEADDSCGPQKMDYLPREDIGELTAENIKNIIFDSGIVGMGGASFPAHIKLNPPKQVEVLIINGAECEPYLTADYRLMLEKTQEIIKGIELVVKCLGIKKVFIAIEDNKPEAIKAFRCFNYNICVLSSAYPQGGEKQLIKSVLNKEVPRGKLPFDLGVVVHNVATVFAIYQSVYLNKPLFERVVTVTGSILEKPKNLLVRIGTPIKELIAFCSPLKEEPAKIINGGPMMGIAQYSTDAPVIKSTNGILLLGKKEAAPLPEEYCIRCGACVRECPAGLLPCMINLASERSIWQEAISYGALDCIECGVCSYVCPANRRLVQSIKRAKLEAVR